MRNQKSVVLVCLVGAWLLGLRGALAQQPERLVPPTVPADPSPADQGALVYYYMCMACHGERGQGLTDEFRAAWAPEDQNCWQAKCHGPNHPQDGFELVRYVPPVISDGTLARSLNAQQLHSYLSQTMPWQNPGGLTDEEYWQVTAFLLRENGVEVGELPLGPEPTTGEPQATPDSRATGAAVIAMPPHVPASSSGPRPLEVAALVGLGLAVVLTVVWVIRRATNSGRRRS